MNQDSAADENKEKFRSECWLFHADVINCDWFSYYVKKPIISAQELNIFHKKLMKVERGLRSEGDFEFLDWNEMHSEARRLWYYYEYMEPYLEIEKRKKKEAENWYFNLIENQKKNNYIPPSESKSTCDCDSNYYCSKPGHNM